MPQSAADIQSRISQIDGLLQSGATSVTVDGTTTTFDLDELRRQRQALQKSLDELTGHPVRRPLASTIHLG